MSKVSLDIWHKTRYLKIIYSKLLEVCEGGKTTEGAGAKPLASEPAMTKIGGHADTEPLDEGKEPEIVGFLKWFRPLVLLIQ